MSFSGAPPAGRRPVRDGVRRGPSCQWHGEGPGKRRCRPSRPACCGRWTGPGGRRSGSGGATGGDPRTCRPAHGRSAPRSAARPRQMRGRRGLDGAAGADPAGMAGADRDDDADLRRNDVEPLRPVPADLVELPSERHRSGRRWQPRIRRGSRGCRARWSPLSGADWPEGCRGCASRRSSCGERSRGGVTPPPSAPRPRRRPFRDPRRPAGGRHCARTNGASMACSPESLSDFFPWSAWFSSAPLVTLLRNALPGSGSGAPGGGPPPRARRRAASAGRRRRAAPRGWRTGRSRGRRSCWPHGPGCPAASAGSRRGRGRRRAASFRAGMPRGHRGRGGAWAGQAGCRYRSSAVLRGQGAGRSKADPRASGD